MERVSQPPVSLVICSTGLTATNRYRPEDSSLAVYTGALLTKRAAAEIILKVQTAFPEMSSARVQLLIEMMIDEGFTADRARDAVKNVIKTYTWDKNPNIARFISFDRRVEALTYQALCTKHDKGEVSWDDYEPIDIGLNKPRWAKKEDVLQYDLKRWDSNTGGDR